MLFFIEKNAFIMQITIKQIKLARISLGWTQLELANRSNVNKGTIVNLEKGNKNPDTETVEKIANALQKGGIEFLNHNGIRDRQDIIHRHEGVNGFKAFMDDVYETVSEQGGDICLFNSKPSLWYKYLGEDWYSMHRQRMADLGDKIRVRIIVEEGEQDFILEAAEHRWFSRDKWRGRIFYAYGDKLAFLNFREEKIHITVFEEADFTESFKIMFDVVWDNETKQPEESK